MEILLRVTKIEDRIRLKEEYGKLSQKNKKENANDSANYDNNDEINNSDNSSAARTVANKNA